MADQSGRKEMQQLNQCIVELYDRSLLSTGWEDARYLSCLREGTLDVVLSATRATRCLVCEMGGCWMLVLSAGRDIWCLSCLQQGALDDVLFVRWEDAGYLYCLQLGPLDVLSVRMEDARCLSCL